MSGGDRESGEGGGIRIAGTRSIVSVGLMRDTVVYGAKAHTKKTMRYLYRCAEA